MARTRRSGGLGLDNAAVGAKQLVKRWDSIFGSAGATPGISSVGADATTQAILNSPTFAGTAASGAGSAAGSAAGGMVASTAAELIPALGQAYALFNLAKMGIQSGTFDNWTSGGPEMPNASQRNRVLAGAAASRDQPGSPVTTPDAAHALPEGWNIPYVNGKFLSPWQMTKLAKGQTLKGPDPYFLDRGSGQILSNSYAGVQPQSVQRPQPQNIWNLPQASAPPGMPADLAAIRAGFQADMGNQGLLAGFNQPIGGPQVSIPEYKRRRRT